METLNKALAFAKRWHTGQVRDNGTPYIEHPIHVAQLVKQAGGGVTAQVAALLHDVIEDTQCPYDDIVKEFGNEVLAIVLEVSIIKGKRTPFKELSPEAALIKLADSIDNLTDMSAWKPKRRESYRKKKREFFLGE